VTGPNVTNVKQAITDIGSIFDVTSQERVNDFLGVIITRNEQQRNVTLTQPQLIDSILQDLNLNQTSNGRNLPSITTQVLHRHEGSEPHDNSFHYRSVIGKLNYLEKSTRPDIAFAVHQCARFATDPRIEHTKAVKLIGRYLKHTSDKGLVYQATNESLARVLRRRWIRG
jgi:hypothetical protein